MALAIFAGSRFETGYDWPAYELIFAALAGTIEDCTLLLSVPAVEPLYVGLNHAVNALGGNVSWIFVIGAIFNMAVIWFVSSRIANAAPLVLLLYFGVTFLAAQMAMERQAIASSFVLLGLLATAYRWWPAGVALILIGAGFHSSVLFLLPLVAMAYWRPQWWIAALFVVPGILIAALGLDLFRMAASAAQVFGDSWIVDKLGMYARSNPAPISLGTLGLIVLHLVALGTFNWFSRGEVRKDRFVTIAIWLTLVMLAAHLYLSALPVVWNRLMLVAVPWQVAALFRLPVMQAMPSLHRVGLVASVAVFSAASLTYFLIKPEAAPYVPYNSTIAVAWNELTKPLQEVAQGETSVAVASAPEQPETTTGEPALSDGEARAMEALAAYVEANPEVEDAEGPTLAELAACDATIGEETAVL